MDEASAILDEATAHPKSQEKLDHWHVDKLRLHPKLYAKEVAEAKAGRAEALWSEANSEYGSRGHPLKRITKGQAADAVRYLDEHRVGWDSDLFQMYGTLNIDIVHDYFFPAIKATHPEAMKITCADDVYFGPKPSFDNFSITAALAERPKRKGGSVAGVLILLAVLGVIIWCIFPVGDFLSSILPIRRPQQSLDAASDVHNSPKSMTEERTWTDSKGRTLQAKLLNISKSADGLYVGHFQRSNGEKFTYHIGLLTPPDIELVKKIVGEKEASNMTSSKTLPLPATK